MKRETSPPPGKGLPPGVKPYDWALKQLRATRAHRVTRGSREMVVAVIDLGYRHHPDMDGHLWENPRPTRGDRHGWDFADGDATLEYRGPEKNEASPYYSGHHVFVAGEIAALAPGCPVMIVRVGLEPHQGDSWAAAIRYAVDNGARVLVIPHGYLAGRNSTGRDFFYGGTDFTYPFDNPDIRPALDYACDHDCLVVRGTADNRGRRVAVAMSAVDSVFSVGSTNRRDEPADICCRADYVEAGAPGGQRHSQDGKDRIWGLGGNRDYMPFTGGCMACGFAGAAAALAWSRHPSLSAGQLRQLLRNTARRPEKVRPDADGWEPRLGYGIIDAGRAVGIEREKLLRDVRVVASSVRRARAGAWIEGVIENRGVFDAEKALVVAYNGDPSRPADPARSIDNPAALLQVKQTGHAIVRVRGLRRAAFRIRVAEKPGRRAWFETFCLDRGDAGRLHRAIAVIGK